MYIAEVRFNPTEFSVVTWQRGLCTSSPWSVLLGVWAKERKGEWVSAAFLGNGRSVTTLLPTLAILLWASPALTLNVSPQLVEAGGQRRISAFLLLFIFFFLFCFKSKLLALMTLKKSLRTWHKCSLQGSETRRKSNEHKINTKTNTWFLSQSPDFHKHWNQWILGFENPTRCLTMMLPWGIQGYEAPCSHIILASGSCVCLQGVSSLTPSAFATQAILFPRFLCTG